MSSPDTQDYREKAITEYGEECQGCSSTENVFVHHKNGDRADNSLSNLIPLCAGCHGKVHGRSNEYPELVRELGYRPRPPERTTLSISEAFMEVLHKRKERGESYEDVLWEILGEATDE
jgi:5-methylcytosine-specific restriction endonuclease McrA